MKNKKPQGDKSIHERLYSEHNSKKLKEGLDVLLSMVKKDEMRVKREEKIEDYLYKDAIMRQKSKERQASRSATRTSSKFSSSVSDKYGMNKLTKDLKNFWETISKESKSSLVNNSSILNSSSEKSEERFNMISIAYLFTCLGYLSKSSQENINEKHIFYDLWTLLRGEESGGVTFDVIETILFTIHGYYKGTDSENDDGEESDIVYRKIGNIMNEDMTK
jgi:hypothetical protein